MKVSQIALVVIVSAVTAFVTGKYVVPNNGTTALVKESTYERVLRTGSIRCGYALWPPFFSKDPNTGQLGGIGYDIAEAIGQKLSLRIEWTAEVTFSDMFSNYNRYDIVCFPAIRTGARSRQTDFSMIFGYVPHYIYARSGDARFDNNYAALNKPDITLATIDGQLSDVVAHQQFPDAKRDSVMEVSGGVQLLMDVTAGKADATIMEPFSFDKYDASNSGKLHAVSGSPVRITNLAFPLPTDEFAFKEMIDGALVELRDTGAIDKIFAHYETGSARILRVADPYK